MCTHLPNNGMNSLYNGVSLGYRVRQEELAGPYPPIGQSVHQLQPVHECSQGVVWSVERLVDVILYSSSDILRAYCWLAVTPFLPCILWNGGLACAAHGSNPPVAVVSLWGVRGGVSV